MTSRNKDGHQHSGAVFLGLLRLGGNSVIFLGPGYPPHLIDKETDTVLQGALLKKQVTK